ncbi:purple acid phosphatase family protein [Paractinoplanes globisporus]|uniref:Purple acid phosphatase family protein n=1 Tax=Paractinoplanes globisporus TaxID=113565 RepID=A0ABW6WBN8_9ACTN|nr:metallophosphoesterase family protein [Actinoplanes globisporus]
MSEKVTSGISRRNALIALGASGVAASGATLIGQPAQASSPLLLAKPERLGAPPVEGLHLTFGADPATQMVVSWTTDRDVARPRVSYGTLEGGHGRVVPAETRVYTDAVSNKTVHVHHATLSGLRPGTYYTYASLHDGGRPDAGTFQTAPRGRSAFTFTSFGDQSVPSVTWQPDGKGGFTPQMNANNTPANADIVSGIEQVDPLFHLLNGDLCYANLDPDRPRTWNAFFANNTRSARYRPWMPAAGNHENEKGNGPLGFSAYQTYFKLPASGSDPELAGLWYAFTVGSVRVISVNNDDVALQDGGDSYVSGYSGGGQRRWLEKELAQARSSRDIDWIVVCMHQVMVSSSDANGSDLGIRENWGPLFDKYQVDLVVCGHEHDYERSLPVRGVVSGSETLTPNPVSSNTELIESAKGTTHMVLGGGGVSGTTNKAFFPLGKAKVITAVGAPPAGGGKRPSTYTFEGTPWLGFRDSEHPYGFAAFTVDPGHAPGATTSIYVTYYNVTIPDGQIAPLETFTLQRRRSDGHR